MGCDEPVGSLVARALLYLADTDWLGSQSPSVPKSAGKAAQKPVTQAEARSQARPPSRRAAVEREMEKAVDRRVAAFRAEKGHVNAGNLGEQVAMRVLKDLGYDVVVTQHDIQSAVSDIVGKPTQMNPEDFVVVTPDGRLSTVNSKAAYYKGSTGIRADGDLSTPGMRSNQRAEPYSRDRADLLSPLDGIPFAQAVKVDLVHKLAQVFEIGSDGRMTRVGEPIPVLSEIAEVLDQYPVDVDPPTGPNVFVGEDA